MADQPDLSRAEVIPAAALGLTPRHVGPADLISRIMAMVQDDLRPFGITVQRRNGLAVENQGATTLFFGPSGLDHVACDIDYGNNNRTDIAFIGDESWGAAEPTGIALADVALHEAGHTFGLHHVNTLQNGWIYFESMGLRYSQPNADAWVQDTVFMDRTFVAYVDPNGYQHGPGPQNAYQTMRRNFAAVGDPSQGDPGIWDNPPAEQVALVDTSISGVFSVSTGGAADTITIQQLSSGAIEVTINGSAYEIVSGLREIRVECQFDDGDQVRILSDLGGVRVSVVTDEQDASIPDAKIDPAAVAYWTGSQLPSAMTDHGGGCCCALCDTAVRHAGGVTEAQEVRRVGRIDATAFSTFRRLSHSALDIDTLPTAAEANWACNGLCDWPCFARSAL